MQTTKLNIKNSDGFKLHAVLELPADRKVEQYAIFAHCFTCNSNFNAVRHISRELTSHGFGVVRFDFTGLGDSEGEFAETNFSANVRDLIDVNDYIKKEYKAPSLLIGHSLGGAAALMAAHELENIQAVATIGAPSEANHVKHLFEDNIDKIRKEGEAEVNIGGRPFKIKKQFLDDIMSNEVQKRIDKLKKPILILHSPLDKIVSIDNAAEIYKAAFHPKSFISLDKADHMLSNKEDSNYAAKIIGTWAEKYINLSQERDHKISDTKGEQVAAHLKVENKFTTQLTNGRHHLLADEPPSVEGEDLGFSPYELLNAALGACTAMTLKMYAARKSWPLEEVYVFLSYESKHSDHADSSNKKVNNIKRKIEIIGQDLTQEQIEKLLEIANKCPVHKTLTETVKISTALIKD